MTNGVSDMAFQFWCFGKECNKSNIYILFTFDKAYSGETQKKYIFYEEKSQDKNPSHIIYCSLQFTSAINGHPLLDGILR